jgi:hypothetical protein
MKLEVEVEDLSADPSTRIVAFIRVHLCPSVVTILRWISRPSENLNLNFKLQLAARPPPVPRYAALLDNGFSE